MPDNLHCCWDTESKVFDWFFPNDYNHCVNNATFTITLQSNSPLASFRRTFGTCDEHIPIMVRRVLLNEYDGLVEVTITEVD